MSKILIFTTSEGHLSIAQGVSDFLLAHKIDSKIIFFAEEFLNLYRPFYLLAPKSFFWLFAIINLPLTANLAKSYLKISRTKWIGKIVEQHKPQVIINTSSGYSSSLVKLKSQYNFKLINIIPNPRNHFRLDFEPKADANLVFDQKLKDEILSSRPDALQKQLVVAGWFVRSQFSDEKIDLSLEKKLNLKNRFVVFVSAGSEGTHQVFSIAKKLSKIKNLTVLFACGNNRQLYNKLKPINQIVPITFTPNIARYMKLANVVIGKIGPNFLFESIFCEKPFIATSWIGGLEERNVEILEKYQVGLTIKDEAKLVEFISQASQDSSKLNLLALNCRRLKSQLIADNQNLISLL